MFHVDEVDDDEAAHVAEAELAGDFGGGFEIGFGEELVLILLAFVAAGVDVDGDEGLGLIDDDVASARQPDLAVEGIVDLLLDAVVLKESGLALVVVDAALGALRDLGGELLHALDGGLVIAGDFVDVLGEEVAHGALDEIGLLEAANRCGLAVADGDGVIPLLDEDVQVADDVAGAFAHGLGAENDAHAFREIDVLEDFAQAGALLRVFDLAGDAAGVVERH